MQLVTHQTGPEGQKVRNLLIEEGADIKKNTTSPRLTDPRHPEGRHDGLQRKAAWTSRKSPTTPRKILKEFVDPLSA